MAQAIDLTNKQFERLTVLEFDKDKSVPGIRYWKCKCSCGNIVSVRANHLVSGSVPSCGCLRKEKLSKIRTTHGMRNTPIYRAWNSMKSRCNLPNGKAHQYYYDRGISYCKEWENFINFYNDMNETYFSHAFLDRKDNDKGYSKENCRWVTVAESNRNKRCVKKK